jgi:hypothetical protein
MPWMRPGADTPMGLRPYDKILRVRPYLKDASAAAIYPGDALILEADGGVAVGAVSSTQYLGVAAEYSPASTLKADFLVYDHPDQLFYVQDDGDTTAMTETHVGSNVDLITTTGDTATLQSLHELDADSAAVTAGLAMKVLGLHEMEGSRNFATTTGQHRKWVVMFNAHLYRDVVGQTGI